MVTHPKTGRVFLDDGTYMVSANLLSTPRRFYPIANITARIRRDPLWLASGIAAFSGLSTVVYGDLLYVSELVTMWALTGATLAIGFGTAILQVDAIGHRQSMVFGSARRIRALYEALRQAKQEESVNQFSTSGNIVVDERSLDAPRLK